MNILKKVVRVMAAALIAAAGWGSVWTGQVAQAAGTTYYVSTSGNDNNNGLSTAAPLKTINKVNDLALQPGDTVLFRCGDTWRGEMLRITRSGLAGSPITFGSYPERDCANQPVISGAQPISGWVIADAGTPNIYVADLWTGDNAGKFGNGINQLFRDGVRLGIGRWPNIDEPDGGYSEIDGQPGADQFTDSQLPAVDWSGATAHIKGMRWYILNRQVTGDSDNTLTVGKNLECYNPDINEEEPCAGWGFWLDSHRATLDQDGEWYYDDATNMVYLYSTSGSPTNADMEGSVKYIESGNPYLGGIILGRNLQEHISYVVVENFEVSKWFESGITTPVNLRADENYQIVLRNNTIRDVNGTGIRLATWVYDAERFSSGPSGWRGGRYITVSGNTIERANHMGIDSFARLSTFEHNTIRDVGMIANLGQSGMGCEFDDGGGQCTEDGDGIRIKVDQRDYTGHSNTIQFNRLERIGYNGMDVFGYGNTVYRNVISQPCFSKGDCGGLRSFGSDDLTDTSVYDLNIRENIIVDSIGNTDGAHSTYDELFGFGLYIDNGSRNVTAQGNVIARCTAAGILYQRSTGSVLNNILFDNFYPNSWGAQLVVTDSGAYVGTHTGNTLLGKHADTWTMDLDGKTNLGTSNNNGFYHASRTKDIRAGGIEYKLTDWQTASGKDGSSVERVDALLGGAEIFYNDTTTVQTVYLKRPYEDLAGGSVPMIITLQSFTARILVPVGDPIANLIITKSAPSGVEEGGSIEYRLTVTNKGGAAASSLVVRDIVPEGTVYASGGTLSVDEVSWSLGSLAADASAEFTFTVTVQPGVKVVRNTTYSVEAAELAPVTGSAVITIVDPELTFLPVVRR
ncbi:MAG: DUF11 domain-containing protein [Anaerolineaceae bacterium]|nr:DUF11 domain-containing protein [Anaerolineaceae bacterium]